MFVRQVPGVDGAAGRHAGVVVGGLRAPARRLPRLPAQRAAPARGQPAAGRRLHQPAAAPRPQLAPARLAAHHRRAQVCSTLCTDILDPLCTLRTPLYPFLRVAFKNRRTRVISIEAKGIYMKFELHRVKLYYFALLDPPALLEFIFLVY